MQKVRLFLIFRTGAISSTIFGKNVMNYLSKIGTTFYLRLPEQLFFTAVPPMQSNQAIVMDKFKSIFYASSQAAV